ncbi:MAG: hypothetical protein HYU52_09760, partial [Acidobacteria bacterium]|nr:hypothetical protein [Acidobacteriota bacterium]
VTGAWCPWPPLWDFSIASLLRALGFTGIDALAVAIWVAPLLGAIFAATLGVAIAWRLGAPAGLVAGLGVAVPMPLIFVSQLARLDHHVAEGPLMVAIAATVAWIAGDASGPVRPGRALVLAIVLTSALFVQTALLLGCGVAFGVLLLLAPCRARLVEGAIGFAVPTLAIGAYRLTLPADYPESAWFLGVPHALLLGGAAVALALAATPWLWRLPRPARAIVAAGLPAVILSAMPSIRSVVGQGGGFFGGDRWLSTIDEFRPFFDDRATIWLDALLLAPTVAAVLLFVAARKDESRSRLALALFAISYGALAITSRRLVYVSVPLIALAGTYAFDGEFRAGRKRLAGWIAALVVLAPGIATFVYLPSAGRSPGVQTEATIRAAIALRSLTTPGRVLAPWDRGHLVAFYSGRQVVIDNFGTMGKPGELEAAATALLSADDEALRRYCRDRGVTFILLNHPIAQLAATARIAGFDERRYARGTGWIEAGPDAAATFWWRAYFANGKAAIAGIGPPAPVRGFHLVWEDEMDVAYAFGLRGDAAQIWAVD